MKAKDLYSALCLDGNTLVLTSTTPALGTLAGALAEAVDATGRLSLTGAAQDAATTDDLLIVTGAGRLLGQEISKIRGVFRLVQGDVVSYYLAGALPDAWTLRDGMPSLPALTGDAAPFSGLTFKKPCVVVAAGMPEVNETALGLTAEVLDDGVRVCAAGAPGFALGAVASNLPAGFKTTFSGAGGPARVRGRLAPRGRTPTAQLDLWWDPGDETVGGAPVINSGLRLDLAGSAFEVLILAELAVGASDLVTLGSELGGSAAAGVFQAEVSPPLGLGALSDLYGMVGATADASGLTDGALPTGAGAPGWAITELTVEPTALHARLAMLDASLAPFCWQPVAGIELSRPVLDVDVDLAGATTTLAYAATAQLEVAEGYEFDVVYTPGVQVAGGLARPADVSLTALIEAVFGPLGIPDFRLGLREGRVAYSIPDKAMRFELGLDGELDLAGGHALVLKDVRLDVLRPPAGPASGTLSGVIELAGVPIQVSATRTGSTGWTFASTVSPSDPIALARLAGELLNGWGAAIPPEALTALDGASLSSLYTRFELATRGLTVEADVQWTPPADLPWAGFKQHTTHLGLASHRDPVTGRREAEVELGWACIAQDRVFEAGVQFDPDDTSFFLLWQSSGDETALGLTSLLKVLGLDNPLGDVAGWGLFDYRRFALDFDRRSRTLSVLAETAAGALGGGHFETQAVIGGDSPLFSASWKADLPGKTLGVEDLLRTVGMTAVFAGLPSACKDAFTFKTLALRYTHRPQPTLLVTAESSTAGYDKAIIGAGRNADGTWGALFAVTFEGTVSVADALPPPVPAEVSQLLSVFTPTFLAISTVDSFTVPAPLDGAGTMDRPAVTIPPFLDGTGRQTTPFGTSRQRLRKGATLGGRLDFTQGDGIARIVRERFGWEKIEGRLRAGKDGVEVETLIPGTFSLPTGKEFGLELHEARLVLGVGTGPDGLHGAIQGACDVRLLDLHARYDLILAVSTTGLDGRIKATEPPLPPPQLLPGVRFKKDYWVDVGIVFEPAGFKLGIDADFYIGPDPTKYCGKARFVLDLQGPVPNPLYLGGSIDRLDAWAMFEAAYALSRMSEMVDAASAGRLSVLKQAQSQYENLQSFAEVIQLENARFHWAEARVILPDGTVVSPGAGFEGTLNVFGWTAYGMFEFSSDPPRLVARLEVSPLHLQHVLSVTGDGQGMRRDGAFVVQPGGAVLQVNSGRPPFLHADLHVTLFDLLHTDVTADVTAQGFRFALRGNAGEITDLTLTCSLTTQGGFSFAAYGSFGLHLDLDLGPIVPGLDATRIHLDAGLDASLDVKITEDTFLLTIAGSFEFEGTRLAMPDLSLDVPFGSLADLPGKIVGHIEDNAEDIFHDVWGGVADTVARIGEEVKEIGEHAIDEVKQAGEQAAEAVEAIGRDLENRAAQAEAAVSQAAAEVATEAGQIAGDAVAAVEGIKAKAEQEVRQLATQAAAAAAAAVQAVAAIEREVEQKVAAVAVEIAHALEEAEHEIVAIEQQMEREVRALLDDAKAVAAGIEREGAAIVAGIEAETQKLRDEIAALVRRAAEALRAAAAAAARRIASAAQSVGSC